MPKKFILIDGNSLAYRAFYALPDTMRTTSGITTNAIYGFTTMLLKVLDEKPDYLAISFDRPEPTFRHKEYKEYKATRQKAPPTLYEQMPHIKEIVKAFNIPIYELAGYEADDVIGTLAKAAEKKEFEVTIFTGDRDMFQLVDDKIKVLHTRRGITDTVLYDEAKVKERYQLSPNQLIDLKALMGDSSDNIPGVPKVGEKTATQLLKEFDSLDNIIKNVDRITKKALKENIKHNIDLANLSKRLGTIVTDAPIEIDFAKCRHDNVDWAKVVATFEKYEFNRLVDKYKQNLPETDIKTVVKEKRDSLSHLDYKCVLKEEEFTALLKKLEKSESFAFDLETTGLNTFTADIVGISFSIESKSAYYVPLNQKMEPANKFAAPNKKEPRIHSQVLSRLQPLFLSDKLKIGHNLKFDIKMLENHDIKVAGPLFDTMVAAYLLDPVSSKLSLKMLGKQFLNREMIKLEELIGKKSEYADFSEVPINVASDYACSDAEVTWALYEIFKLALKGQKLDKLFYEVEMPLLATLIAMEINGIAIDTKLLNKLSQDITKKLKEAEEHIFCLAGESFNINSPKQLSNILFNKLMLPVIKKTKTGASTNAEVLEELSSQKFEIAQRLLEFRQLNKLKNTYVDVLPTLVEPKTDRIHTSFNQTITATGRLSSSNPNLQNIPARGEWGKLIRGAFIPGNKNNKLIAADYSQVELRILAHLSQDKQLIKAFKEDKDIHTATAEELGIPRDASKAVNFGIIYGISDFGLSKQLKIKRTEAAEYIAKYFNKHTGVKEFIDKTLAQAREDGFVKTLLGRKRPIPDINSPNQGLRSFAERTAINTVVQGTAADLIKVAMVNINNKLRITDYGLQMILQVHDELVFDCPKSELEEAEKMIKEEMVNALELTVPVKVDLGSGQNWAEAK